MKTEGMTPEEINARHAEKMAKRKAARDKILATKTKEKGLLIVHTGKGKGKTTAAMGLAVRAVGNAIIELGGGRHSVGEALDLSVGLSNVAPIGTRLDAETPLAVVHAASDKDAAMAKKLLLDACQVGEEPPGEAPVIVEIVKGLA